MRFGNDNLKEWEWG